MNYLELTRTDFAKFNELQGACIKTKRSDAQEKDIYYAVWSTENLGEIHSEEFPSLLTCQNYVKKILEEASNIENDKEGWDLGDIDE